MWNYPIHSMIVYHLPRDINWNHKLKRNTTYACVMVHSTLVATICEANMQYVRSICNMWGQYAICGINGTQSNVHNHTFGGGRHGSFILSSIPRRLFYDLKLYCSVFNL